MNRDLRTSHKAHLLSETAGLCDLIWQGDFGAGVATGSGIWSDPGANPYVLYGPLSATANTVMVNGVPQLPFRVGSVVAGDFETEWVFCRWIPGSTLDLLPGQVFIIDENFTATLLSTAAHQANASLAVNYVFNPATLAGTYYLWLARAGRVICQAAGSSLAQGQGETTATAGQVKFLNTHTSTSWTCSGLSAYGASSNITFKGDTVSGSPYILNVASQISINGVIGGITDLMLGATITGTGMPANACIAAIDQKGQGGSYRVSIGTATTGVQKTLQNASATNAAQTFTLTTVVQALAFWPTLANVVT